MFTSTSVSYCSKLNWVVRLTFELSSIEHTVGPTLLSKQNDSTVIVLQYAQHARSLTGTMCSLHLGHSKFSCNVCESMLIIWHTIFCWLSTFRFYKSICSMSVRSIIVISVVFKSHFVKYLFKDRFLNE